MSKRKNDIRNDERLAADVVLFGMLMVVLFGGWCVLNYVAQNGVTLSIPADCVDFGETDFVMIGVEGYRGLRRDDPVLLDELGSMVLTPIDAVPVDAVRHLDVGLYDGWRLQGTLLFWQVHMQDWYVQINDGTRGDCGVYRVDDGSVLYLMDAIR